VQPLQRGAERGGVPAVTEIAEASGRDIEFQQIPQADFEAVLRKACRRRLVP